MSIAYSGGATYATISGGASRSELVDNIKGQLVTTGWSVASGTSGDWKLDSGITPAPASLQGRVRIWDPGSGNCARMACMLTDDSCDRSAGPIYLLPGASLTYRVLANPCQFLIQETPWSLTGRKFGIVCVPSIPDFFVAGGPNDCQSCMFSLSNAVDDATATNQRSWSSYMSTHGSCQGVIWNASGWAGVNGWGSAGSLSLANPTHGFANQNLPLQWAVDESYHAADALFEFSPLHSEDSTQFRIRGQLWDCMLISGAFQAGDEITFDGHTFVAVTHNASEYGKYTLFCLKQE
jgi:hypothetical protein